MSSTSEGAASAPDARQVLGEDVNIPILHLFRRGEPNRTLLEIIRTNVREPQQVVGDIFSFAASNDTGSKRLISMMQEFGEFIIENSRLATVERIRALPNGIYENELIMDGYDTPVLLRAALNVEDERIHVDYTGTSPASGYGINVVLNYTKAYTCFGVKCVIAPDIPNNYGSLLPITFSAPEGSILNAPRPYAVAARHIIGHLLPDTVLGCLHQVMAGGGGGGGGGVSRRRDRRRCGTSNCVAAPLFLPRATTPGAYPSSRCCTSTPGERGPVRARTE